MRRGRPKMKQSIQFTFITIFALMIALTIGLLNVYPTISARDLTFSAKRSALLKQAGILSSSLAALEQLSPDGVHQVMKLVGPVDYDRVVVTDNGGTILYDSAIVAEILASHGLRDMVDRALDGREAFFCRYTGSEFLSRASAPVLNYGSVIGTVYLYERDRGQAELINSIQTRLRYISIVSGVIALAVIVFFSKALTARLRELLAGLRIVREGDYEHRVEPRGRDEVTELSQEFNDMADKLQRTEELRRRFVSDASHELRTPLASIRLLSDSILQNEDMDGGTMREFVADIGSEAERLQRMTEKLMRLTRMDSRVPTERTAVDLKRVAERTRHLLLPLAEKKQVTVYAELAESCTVFASADDIFQIIFNLAENAVKYNGFGGSVFLRLSREERDAVLTVEDTGIGIPAEDVPHIFDRFYRVDKARSSVRGGSGLGLSIVHDAVEANGGRITVERREPMGTRFTVRFPLISPEVLP